MGTRKIFDYNFLDFTKEDLKSGKMRTDDIVKKIKEILKNTVKQQLSANIRDQTMNNINSAKQSSTLPPGDNIYQLNAMCDKIPFNDNIDSLSPNEMHEKCTYNDPTDFTIPHDSYQYVIGRIQTLADIDAVTKIKNCKKIKFLNLEGSKMQWSIFINDLFIMCSVAHGQTMKKINKNNIFEFPIRAIYDKRCRNAEKCKTADNNCINVDETFSITAEDLKKLTQMCIIPKEHTKQSFDPVTFREIVILTKIFDMHVYEWTGPVSNLGIDAIYYFFSHNDIPQSEFDEKKKPFKKVDVKFKENISVQIAGDYYKYQYEKYKAKYLNLKQQMNL